MKSENLSNFKQKCFEKKFHYLGSKSCAKMLKVCVKLAPELATVILRHDSICLDDTHSENLMHAFEIVFGIQGASQFV
jgi:hypothetical protein